MYRRYFCGCCERAGCCIVYKFTPRARNQDATRYVDQSILLAHLPRLSCLAHHHHHSTHRLARQTPDARTVDPLSDTLASSCHERIYQRVADPSRINPIVISFQSKTIHSVQCLYTRHRIQLKPHPTSLSLTLTLNENLPPRSPLHLHSHHHPCLFTPYPARPVELCIHPRPLRKTRLCR